MKRVMIRDLKPAMVVGTDIFEPGGSMFPLVTEGFVLDKDTIFRLKSKNIAYVLIQVPKGYRGAPGEVFELYSVKEDVDFDGRLELHKDMQSGLNLRAGETIVVSCDVAQGTNLESRTGNISIKGSVLGTEEKPVRITAAGNIVIQGASDQSINFTEIKAGGTVSSTLDINDSSVTAGGDITFNGSVVNCQIQGGARIKLKDCGADKSKGCIISSTPVEHVQLYSKLNAATERIEEIEAEQEKLQGIITLVRKLGSGISAYPPDKRKELASAAKHYKEIEDEHLYLINDRNEIVRELTVSLALKRIIITGDIFPPTTISIEDNSLDIIKKERCLSFFVKDFKLLSVPFGS